MVISALNIPSRLFICAEGQTTDVEIIELLCNIPCLFVMFVCASLCVSGLKMTG